MGVEIEEQSTGLVWKRGEAAKMINETVMSWGSRYLLTTAWSVGRTALRQVHHAVLGKYPQTCSKLL